MITRNRSQIYVLLFCMNTVNCDDDPQSLRHKLLYVSDSVMDIMFVFRNAEDGLLISTVVCTEFTTYA